MASRRCDTTRDPSTNPRPSMPPPPIPIEHGLVVLNLLLFTGLVVGFAALLATSCKFVFMMGDRKRRQGRRELLATMSNGAWDPRPEDNQASIPGEGIALRNIPPGTGRLGGTPEL